MKSKNKFLLVFLLFIFGCEQINSNKSPKFNPKINDKYKNSGFALIYSSSLNLKNLDQRSFQIFHKNLKKKSLVKITNPDNGKFLIAEVKSNRVKFSNFYNSVITERIVETLDLSIAEPFVKIVLITNNSTFLAKKAKTFDEEKEVAQKAPIDGIEISNLNENLNIKNQSILNHKFSYSIKIADFYYRKSADLMVDRIKKETLLKDIKLIKLSETNYRVLLGPFNDIKSLKESFEKMNSLYFENLEIIKNV